MSNIGNYIVGGPEDALEDDDLYTADIIRLLKQCKDALPDDYTLATRTEGPFIFIVVPRNQFDYRPVEDKTRIAVTLERLKNFIRTQGVYCEIETVTTLTPFG